VSEAIFANRLMPLSSIDSVNGFGKNRADLAYSQSHLSLLFLIDQYGIDVVNEILASAKKTGSFWLGVNAVLSITPREFEQLARSYITTRYRLVFLIADYPAFWVGIVFLFLVASLVAVIRKRKGMDRMESDENAGDGREASDGLQAPPQSTAAAAASREKEVSGAPLADGFEDEDEEYGEFDEDDDDYILGDGIELEDEEDDEDFRPPEKDDRKT
jgi:hypothetical protein